MYGEGLAHASPAYLASLERGLWLVRVGSGLMIIVLLGGMLAAMVLGLILPWTLPHWVQEVLLVLVAMACVGTYVAGWWLVTVPDPRFSKHADTRSTTCARWSAVALVATFVFFVVFSLIAPVVLTLFDPVLVILVIVQHGCGSVYLRVLARRTANRRAMSHAKSAVVAIVVVCVCSAIQMVFNWFGVQVPGGSLGGTLVKLFVAIVPVAILVSAIIATVQHFSAVGLLRDDLRRFIFQAKHRG